MSIQVSLVSWPIMDGTDKKTTPLPDIVKSSRSVYWDIEVGRLKLGGNGVYDAIHEALPRHPDLTYTMDAGDPSGNVEGTFGNKEGILALLLEKGVMESMSYYKWSWSIEMLEQFLNIHLATDEFIIGIIEE